MTDLSIIIVNWNTRELLRACLASVNQHTTGLEHEVIVVDNHSADGSPAMVRAEFPEVRLIENPQNLGFAAGNNQGIRLARGRAVLLLNSDTELVENSAKTLFDFLFSKETIGAAGGLLIYPGGGAQWSYGYEPSLGRMLWITLSGLLRIPWGRKPVAIVPGTDAGPRPVEYIVGADLMIKKNVLDRVGLLDESFFAYFEETDLCARIRQAGFEVWYTPATRIIHRIGSSFSAESVGKLRIYYTSLFRYLRKHRGGYRLARAYLLVKFGLHALFSRDPADTRIRCRAIRQAGLEYARPGA